MDFKGKRRLKKAVAIMLFFTMTLALCGCASFDNFVTAFFMEAAETAAESIKIGVYEPMTGADSKAAEAEIRGIELAHSQRSSVLGKEVELVYADNKSDIHVADEVIQGLIQKSPAVVLGSYGSVYSLAAVSYLEEAQIPAISVTGSNPIVTDSNPFYFSMSYADTYEGVVMAKYAYETLGTSAVATLKPTDSDIADAQTSSFSEKIIQLSGDLTIVKAAETYTAGAEDFTEQLTAIKESGAEAIFTAAKIDDAVRIMKQAQELGLNVIFLGTSSWDSEQFLKAETTADVRFPAAFDAKGENTEATEAFLTAYREKYGADAEPTSAEALGYDAYMLALDAIERAGTSEDGDLIRQAIQNTSQLEGASGSITFDSSGSPIKSVSIMTISDGKIKSAGTVEPKWSAQ